MPRVLRVCSDWMKEYNEAYNTGYYQIIQSVREQMDQMKNYDIREQYDMLVGEITENIVVSRLDSSIKGFYWYEFKDRHIVPYLLDVFLWQDAL